LLSSPAPRPAVRATGCCLALALTALAGTPAGPAAAAVPDQPFLAELHYDNSGTDTGEFVEVQVPHGTTTEGWAVVLYNGADRTLYSTRTLPAVTAGADAPAVAVLDYPSNGIQNGAPDGVALLDAAGAVVEFLSYEGAFVAANGPAAGRTSTDIGVSETGTGPAGESLSRRYDPASDTVVWQGPSASTRGAVNPPLTEEPPVPVCDIPPTHEVGQVQGPDTSTPLPGTPVTVRGVVVGDVPGLSGFYLQDADGDGDDATSDGVFVASAADVGLGDSVAATGTAVEDFGQTQLNAGSEVDVCTPAPADPLTALPEPAELDLPADGPARERLEGMLVAPADVLTVSEVFELTRFGELTLSEGGLLVQPTEAALPGADAAAVAAQNVLRRIVLDDASTARTSTTARPYLSPATPVRVGDELTFTAPVVLGYGFGQWRLQPADGTPEGTFSPQNTRPPAPEGVGGDVTVASFTVLNYFLTFADPPGRGADDAAELERQADKIVAAIGALDADVIALQEIEDTAATGYDPSPDRAVADLVRRLDAAAGEDRWAYSPLPAELLAVDRDAIRNAIVYRADVVAPAGPPVGLVDEAVWGNAREPLAATFAKDGDRFTVVANHFKSKSRGPTSGPDAPTGDNLDAGDGQGFWNGDRVRQARSLAEFADRLRAQTGDEDVLLLGDLNAYTREDPVELLRGAGFTDLGSRFDAGRYSYVFDDMSGSLDHALATDALTAKVTGAAHWNINAVESFAYQYDGDPALYAANPYRASDHDPLVVGIDLEERCAGRLPTLVGTEGEDVLRGTDGPDVVMGLGGDDLVQGLAGEDVLCGGAGADDVVGGNGDDVILGGFGDDALVGGNGEDCLVGGPGEDTLVGGRGANRLEPDGPES
jgi:uncharacterized protein